MSSVLLCLVLCFFLFPLATYCWALAVINRRPGPLLVPGQWDFVGLLFAASGFLLVVGPAILTGLYYRALREPPRSQPLGIVLWQLVAHQWSVWLAYYVLVVGGALLLLLRRRHKTVLYNVDPDVLQTVLAGCLARLNLSCARQGNRLLLGHAPVEPGHEESREPVAGRPVVLDLEIFRSMYHVTLHWHAGAEPVRTAVEAELERALAGVQTENNTTGAWLLAISGILFALMFVAAGTLVLGSLFRRW